MSNFKQYSKYYDLLYKNKNYQEESNYIIKKIKKVASNATQILELGSGSGAHAHFFCKEGYKVTGVERSLEMINLAKSKQIAGFTTIVGDISSFKLEQKYDVAVSLFHVVSYLTDNKSLINCFKTVYEHLKKDGFFMFDIWYSPAVYHQKPETRIKRLEDDKVEIIRIAESTTASEKNTVLVNFEVLIKDKITGKTDVIKEEHLMRHFSIPEIKIVAELTGFEVHLAEEFLTQNSPSEATWGVFFILKKV